MYVIFNLKLGDRKKIKYEPLKFHQGLTQEELLCKRESMCSFGRKVKIAYMTMLSTRLTGSKNGFEAFKVEKQVGKHSNGIYECISLAASLTRLFLPLPPTIKGRGANIPRVVYCNSHTYCGFFCVQTAQH